MPGTPLSLLVREEVLAGGTYASMWAVFEIPSGGAAARRRSSDRWEGAATRDR